MKTHRIINTITAGPAVLAAGTVRFYVVQGARGALRMFDEFVDGSVVQGQGTPIATPACVLDAVKAHRALDEVELVERRALERTLISRRAAAMAR